MFLKQLVRILVTLYKSFWIQKNNVDPNNFLVSAHIYDWGRPISKNNKLINSQLNFNPPNNKFEQENK